MVKTKNTQAKEKVLVTLTRLESYEKIRKLLPDYKLSFSEFVDEMNAAFVDAVENNNGHLDLTIAIPKKVIIKNKVVEDSKD